MNNQYQEAECLMQAGCNANELAEALQITRQSALAVMRVVNQKHIQQAITPPAQAFD